MQQTRQAVGDAGARLYIGDADGPVPEAARAAGVGLGPDPIFGRGARERVHHAADGQREVVVDAVQEDVVLHISTWRRHLGIADGMPRCHGDGPAGTHQSCLDEGFSTVRGTHLLRPVHMSRQGSIHSSCGWRSACSSLGSRRCFLLNSRTMKDRIGIADVMSNT